MNEGNSFFLKTEDMEERLSETEWREKLKYPKFMITNLNDYLYKSIRNTD